jgi:hypothetical protein
VEAQRTARLVTELADCGDRGSQLVERRTRRGEKSLARFGEAEAVWQYES